MFLSPTLPELILIDGSFLGDSAAPIRIPSSCVSKSWQVIRKSWHALEGVHTAVWLCEVFGVSALTVAAYAFALHRVQNDAGLAVILALFTGGSFLIAAPRIAHMIWRFARGSAYVPVSCLDKRFEPRHNTPEGESPYFKRKIRVVLQNDSRDAIEIEAADWVSEAGDLAIQPKEGVLAAASGLRLEDKNAGGWKRDKWPPRDLPKITVPSKYAFEVWVGLSHGYSDQDLIRHERAGKIGILVLRVSFNGKTTEHKLRVT
jgi:hypothetical protein